MASEIIDLSASVEEFGLEPDNTGKVIYETSDVDESEVEVSKGPQNEDIIEDPVSDVANSTEVYESTQLSADQTDFSGRLDSLPTYKSRFVKETPKQKLARIQREILEVQHELEVENSNSNEKDLLDVKNLYKSLSRFNTEKMGELQRRLLSDSESQETETVRLPNIKLDPTSIMKLEKLEQKLTSMESQIGISTDARSSKSIISTINDIYRDMNILKMDEQSLTNFQKRMKEISDQYDQSIIGRRAQKDPELMTEIEKKMKTTEAKLQDIYVNYQLLNRYSKLIPQITQRLKSLSSLHGSINDMNNTVAQINDHISSMDGQIEKWSTLVNTANDALTSHETAFDKKKNTLEAQLHETESRITKLQSK
ncbi:dynamitin [Kluyveromyces marxianus DMKU3-1042]|uniref:Dynamitin n=1 Tax=Kluyveromyces marxianus (strain DMKU3-1042 / BCC 29191 / NBRC 104275) TaxID=1003335 RepID=W0T5L8_KLUMD|nr:dynamitin [Kluyveromyces marxianus DMKU3-1042]BAO38116.1 dynamitin [Kluyveromyces marxianus DMKU3-1042]